VEQRCGHVEAAAVHVEIGEGQRAGVGEAAAEHLQQQVRIFGVGVVVPAEPVITERQAGDNGDDGQNREGEVVARLTDRAPRRRFEGRCRNG